MKHFPLLFPYVVSALIVVTFSAHAQTPNNAQQVALNIIAYEHKAPQQYETVSYMPYYPAYGMVSFKSPKCNAEIAGYIDPFAIKKNKLTITYKACKISFDINQKEETLSNPTENTACQNYHPKTCNFTQISSLKRVPLENRP